MDSGFYTSAVGMLDGFNVENNISDNLANMQTPGFKEKVPVLADFSNVLYESQLQPGIEPAQAGAQIGSLGRAPQITSYGLDLAQGNPTYTGSPLDLMLVGNGFFAVRAGAQTLLTRNGGFHRTSSGELQTSQGYAVLGKGGRPLNVPPGVVQVMRTGEVLVDGKSAGSLALAQVPVGKPLTEAGTGYYVGPGTPIATAAPGVGVLQGYLETSNVDMATQMSAMMSAQRAYEANLRMLQMQDDTMSLAASDLGKAGA